MRIWSCCNTTYTHNDTVGCCGKCGNVFSGTKAFEAHQVGPRDEQGVLACVDPANHFRTQKNDHVHPAFEVAAHRGEKPLWRLWKSEEEKTARREQISGWRQASEQAESVAP